jgi:hypothetical protein
LFFPLLLARPLRVATDFCDAGARFLLVSAARLFFGAADRFDLDATPRLCFGAAARFAGARLALFFGASPSEVDAAPASSVDFFATASATPSSTAAAMSRGADTTLAASSPALSAAVFGVFAFFGMICLRITH